MKSLTHRNILTARAPLAVACAAVALTSVPVQAQQQGRTSALLEEVVVTARKREEGAQEVPLSISAFNSDQIQALKVRDLFSLSTGLPNVVLDDIGTARGTANFSIRGLGINSSIPGIDPTVGVFINQVFLGNNVGVIFDTFDLESIEVLRGPQGILFGRNVTGGAVLLNTKRPGDEFDASVKAAADTTDDGGWNRYYMGAVGGPVTDDFGARLVLYYNDDQGWVENKFTGEDVGAIEQFMVRPTLEWAPTDTLAFTLIYQYTDIEGDGPVAQSHTNGSGIDPLQFEPNGFSIPDRDSFDVAYDEVGFQDSESDSLTFITNWDVDFGQGTVTNIFGWREGDGESRADIDGQPVWLFHAPAANQTEQFSNELRYNGVFNERANVTAGLYYFENEINYDENRELGGIMTWVVVAAASPTFHGGGNLDIETYGVFGAVDYDLTDLWTLNLGIRYSYEEKSAEVATLPPSQDMPCSVIAGTCNIDFVDDEDWDSWAPKIGATYHLSDNARMYGHWTRGFRSGGYNLRNTSTDPEDVPGPFDQEQVDNFEIGYKSTFGRGKLNAALFYNQIEDMQREVNKAGPIGVIQLIQNTADAEILGFEIDAAYSITENLLATATLGYIDAEYEEVVVDLNEDGVVDGRDEDLDLPRAPEWTYSVALNHDLNIGSWGYMTTRVSYAYRDETAFTDSNLGFILDQDVVDAGIDLYSNDGHWIFSLYGRNLLDEVKHGGDTQLPPDLGGVVPWGGTFSPLAKGRHYGAEVRYNF
ncbi:MAG: TonB-dependent receptor [Halioglobus sp.]|nr:TonB-dependent receptor [Halioglobus sp.]